MTFKYDEIVPWGRSFDEYRRMFALTDEELNLKIIGCGDGPASFNAEMAKRGRRVMSCDPLYRFTAEQIRARIETGYETVVSQTWKNRHKFVWDAIKSPDDLGRIRMSAMLAFLDDYEKGKQEGRYVPDELPALSAPSSSFDLALCSHFLFLYSDHLSLDFHVQAALEMCRVAADARIFPVLDYNSRRSGHIEPMMQALDKAGLKPTIEKVPYEFQRGGNEMMRIVGAGGYNKSQGRENT